MSTPLCNEHQKYMLAKSSGVLIQNFPLKATKLGEAKISPDTYSTAEKQKRKEKKNEKPV